MYREWVKRWDGCVLGAHASFHPDLGLGDKCSRGKQLRRRVSQFSFVSMANEVGDGAMKKKGLCWVSFRAKAKTKVRQLRGGGGLEDRRF